jgi:UDP-N-acetylmuramoylalanine--D-glutamate ligase
MGLGLNGGGIESARFFARRGAGVTVTDLRREDVLEPSLKELAGLPLRYVLGGHEYADFEKADLVIKNPAVRPDSPFLAKARRIETDISIFLSLCTGPVLAVTGSKGKSTTSSALHYGLSGLYPGARLGGNITKSPLAFLENLGKDDPVVLELSSWQLGDLRGKRLLDPRIALVTNILPDHLDRYGSMEDYVRDKKVIFEGQSKTAYTLYLAGEAWGNSFAAETPGTPVPFSRFPLPEGRDGAWLFRGEGFAALRGDKSLIVPADPRLIGEHQKINLLAAGLALRLFGLPPELIQKRLAEFPGIEHRLELCGEKENLFFYNDSAATIPEALTAAVKSFTRPVLLIAGGTDKKLDFSVFAEAAAIPRGIYLLEGNATVKIQALLEGLHVPYNGPYASLENAFAAATGTAAGGEVILFSPGCASFGMFLNEFDRGRRFKALVKNFAGK